MLLPSEHGRRATLPLPLQANLQVLSGTGTRTTTQLPSDVEAERRAFDRVTEHSYSTRSVSSAAQSKRSSVLRKWSGDRPASSPAWSNISAGPTQWGTSVSGPRSVRSTQPLPQELDPNVAVTRCRGPGDSLCHRSHLARFDSFGDLLFCPYSASTIRSTASPASILSFTHCGCSADSGAASSISNSS